MRPPRPLPVELQNRVFTRAELIEQGYSDSRLTAADVERLGRGLYCLRDRDVLDSGGWESAGIGDLYSIQAASSASWFSYSSTCSLYQIPVAQHARSERLHVSVLHQVESLGQLPGVTVHRPDKVVEGEIRRLNRLRVSGPEPVFLEMAGVMREPGLVALGDQPVRVPRVRFEGRSQPRTTPNKLWRCLDPSDPTSPVADLAYPAQRIALQYEGAYHFTPEQQATDQWRNSRFGQAGWTVLLTNRVDLRQGFRGAVRRLATALLDAK